MICVDLTMCAPTDFVVPFGNVSIIGQVSEGWGTTIEGSITIGNCSFPPVSPAASLIQGFTRLLQQSAVHVCTPVSNVILRFLRIRPPRKQDNSFRPFGIYLFWAKQVVLDHLSIGWSIC